MDGGNRTSAAEGPGKAWMRWPDRVLGPRPGLKEINLACWGLLAGLSVVRLGVPLWVHFKTGAGSNPLLPADFIYFYGIGRIANEYPLTRLYDYSLQLETFNRIFPLHDGAYGPSPYPPFVALFFSLLARLPFAMAFFIWAAASLALYLAGIGAIIKDIFPGERLKTSLIFCLALAFFPFAIGTFVNGQLAAVAVWTVGLAIAQERDARPFSSGLALSILSYKPTLLLLLIPMLLLTRRFKTMAGLLTGAGMLVLLATAFGGIEIWPAYAHFLSLFGRVAGVGGPSGLPLWKFVDLGSCVQAITGGRSGGAWVFLLSAAGIIATGLAVLLWKSAKGSRPAQTLAWAATLTWTLLLNVYVPIYDSVLATLAVVLTLGALKEMEWSAAEGWIVVLSILMLAASWETDAIAKDHGIQILSILLAVLGLAQLYLLQRAIGRGLAQKAFAPGAK